MYRILLTFMTLMFLMNLLISTDSCMKAIRQFRFADDEIKKAASVIIMGIEEDPENHLPVSEGRHDEAGFDEDSLFTEYREFMEYCRYIEPDDIKLCFLVFNGAITYYNTYGNEMYREAIPEEITKEELENKIKRQLVKVFETSDFSIDEKLFDELDDKTFVMVYEKSIMTSGFYGRIIRRNGYVKIRIKT